MDRFHKVYMFPLRFLERSRCSETQRSIQGLAPHEPRSWRANAEVGHLPWKNHGKTMEKPWKTMENHGKTMGKPWKNHGTLMKMLDLTQDEWDVAQRLCSPDWKWRCVEGI